MFFKFNETYPAIFTVFIGEQYLYSIYFHSDNAAIHHTQQSIDAMNATGALVIFLPPYSPDLMPCEELFAKTKSYLRDNEIAWLNCPVPELMVFHSFLQVTDNEIRKYIQHAEYA